ncbi:TPA: hypothetical protein U2J46_003013 [Providencia stuartii]|uniref:hypothetical protein n=1 Tax=Providencia stuartii TaxID=588 RepID=UPI000D98787F|nr:hypothetical protein [Providencia stuartii]MTC67759.1 hypothetical protein [Providencia stuartii]SPY68510.1 Uncharacterised protein [Providencia stuartii]SUC43422.1 Uncharacterised protein [Providencia stuartii]HEM7518652.1 hypothetical protein [Providencia stuartii]
MNDELLEYAKELKKRSESLIKAELENEEFTYRLNDWDKLIHPKMLIQLCDEVERINSLEPVGYIMESSFDNIREYGYTHLNEERTEKINIPLYKLD